MNDPAFIRRGDAADDVNAKVDRGPGRQTVRGHAVAQRAAFEQFGDGVGDAPFGREVMDRKDVWMRQRLARDCRRSSSPLRRKSTGTHGGT
jgi:hypothetical protein